MRSGDVLLKDKTVRLKEDQHSLITTTDLFRDYIALKLTPYLDVNSKVYIPIF